MQDVHQKQVKVAGELFKKIKENQPLLFNKDKREIKYFDFFTIVPSFRSLGKVSFAPMSLISVMSISESVHYSVDKSHCQVQNFSLGDCTSSK